MTENLKQYEHKKLLLITMQLHTSILLKTKKKPRLSEKKKKKIAGKQLSWYILCFESHRVFYFQI